MNKKIKPLFIDFLFLLIIFIFIYWKVLFIFFQQDEWLGFGLMVAQDQGLPFNLGIDYHFVPLNLFIANFLFKIFGLNYIVYNLVGLFFHLINGILVYIIALKFSKRRIIALISAVLFISSSVASQLVMWPGVSLATLSLTFTLLTWIILLKNQVQEKIRWSFLIAILIILAFLTMEYSLGFLLFIPTTFLLLYKKITWKEKIIFLSPIFIFCFTYFIVRKIFISSASNSLTIKLTNEYIFDFASKLLYIPLKYLSQLTIPESMLINISHLFTKNIVKAETFIFNYLTIGIGLIILLIVVYFLDLVFKNRKIKYKNSLILILLFLLSSLIPFLLLPGNAGSFIIFPPRYLYFGLAGISLLIGVMLNIVFYIKAFKSNFNIFFKALIILFVFFMITLGINENWKREKVLVIDGNKRENILKIIQKSYPKLPQKVIFFIESDSSYYLQKDKILPFQSGLGQTLLVWYHQENFGLEFYTNKFLWEIDSQGYYEIENRGFGYFREYQLLKETVNKYQIPVESVISFSWKGKSEELVDINSKVREQLKKEVYE